MPFVMNATGRLAHEPQLNVGRGMPWTEFRLLDNRFKAGEQIVEAATFVAFGELAEQFCQRAEKGQMIHAWGHQQTEKFTGNDHVERNRTRFVLFEFVPGPRPARSRAAESEARAAPTPRAPSGADDGREGSGVSDPII